MDDFGYRVSLKNIAISLDLNEHPTHSHITIFQRGKGNHIRTSGS